MGFLRYYLKSSIKGGWQLLKILVAIHISKKVGLVGSLSRGVQTDGFFDHPELPEIPP